MNYVLAGRTISQVLGRSAGGAVEWWKAAGVTPIAAYAPKGAASLADSYINLANPGTYNAAPGVAPTWNTAAGWTFNGLTQYLTTGITPTSSTTVLVRFTDATIGVYTIVGSRTTNYILRPRDTGDIRGYYLASGASGTGAGSASGVIGISGSQGYFNGIADGSTMTTGTYSFPLYIGALNNLGGVAQFWPGKITSFWIANSTLNAAAVATQSAAMP